MGSRSQVLLTFCWFLHFKNLHLTHEKTVSWKKVELFHNKEAKKWKIEEEMRVQIDWELEETEIKKLNEKLNK